MIEAPRLCHIAGETRILRPYLVIEGKRGVPGILVAQGAVAIVSGLGSGTLAAISISGITGRMPGVPLVSGLTATVTVRDGGIGQGAFGALTASLRDVFAPPPSAPHCIPAAVGGSGPEARLPELKATPPRTPEEIDPGLTTEPIARPMRP